MADTQTIKDRIDIVQLIQEYVPLKKAGVNWKANCPFHHEKTPSFMVQPDKQIWHCFGCGKGGDIFSFIEEIEGLEFIEALKLLAQRAGVKIETTYQNEVNQSVRNRLLEINEAAANFFHRFLNEMPTAKIARDYLGRRRLNQTDIDSWQIGYIPDQWDLLTQYLIKKGFGIEDLVLAGLTIKRDGADAKTGRGYYDRFRGRVMFPILDAHGNCVGFTGRVLVETENSGGKYVNTPQTMLYDKSRVLYGLYKAKTEIKNKDLAVIVEGQMDVIANHVAGMANVVAASGTALTTEQVKLLRRYTNNLAMAFDADAAGENAGLRGVGVALAEGMSVRVITLPKGFAKDADECIGKDKNVWFKSVENSQAVMDWHFARVFAKYNLSVPKEKREAAAILLSEIAILPYAIERDDWLKKMSDKFSITMPILREELVKVMKKTPGAASPVINPVSADDEDHPSILFDEFWSLVVKFPGLYGQILPELRADYFSHSQYDNLYVESRKLYNSVGRLEISALRQFFDKSGGENLIDLLSLRPYRLLGEMDEAGAAKEIKTILGRIADEWKKVAREKLQMELSKAEAAGNKEAVDAILKELMAL